MSLRPMRRGPRNASHAPRTDRSPVFAGNEHLDRDPGPRQVISPSRIEKTCANDAPRNESRALFRATESALGEQGLRFPLDGWVGDVRRSGSRGEAELVTTAPTE